MAYAEYNDYYTLYYGEVLPPEDAIRWLDRASDMLDALTHDRLRTAYPTEYADKIRKATCALADALYNVDQQQKASAVQKSDAGGYHGAIESIKSGKQSVSYASPGSGASVYAAAAADEGARLRLCFQAVGLYLANVPDANGVNLLYAGEDRHV